MRRGDVYRFKLPKGVGHEQHGARFGVVVQADAMLPRTVVLVAPTSQSVRPASFRPEVVVAGDATRVLVEQLGAVDVQRLGRRVGTLVADEMWAVDDALDRGARPVLSHRRPPRRLPGSTGGNAVRRARSSGRAHAPVLAHPSVRTVRPRPRRSTSAGCARVCSLEVPERALSEQTIGGGGPVAWLAQRSPVCPDQRPRFAASSRSAGRISLAKRRMVRRACSVEVPGSWMPRQK